MCNNGFSGNGIICKGIPGQYEQQSIPSLPANRLYKIRRYNSDDIAFKVGIHNHTRKS
jgi:hypothetical protein